MGNVTKIKEEKATQVFSYEVKTLESIEDIGDTVLVQDFRTGESFLGLIEEQDFINKTPTDKRFSGYGGVLLITIRKV